MNKVSVIIPIYNVERYLRDCLDSVVNQTLGDIEIICVDDGSTDGSARIVMEYMERFSNITLIRQENSGPSIARNAALEVASGEYIYFLDSDDAIDLKALEKLYSTAAAEQLDVLYFNTETVFESEALREKRGDEQAYHDRPGDYSGLCTGQTMFARMRKDLKYLAPVWIQLFRRAFLEDNSIRFYPGIIHEDNLFSFQCAMTAQRVNYIPDRLYLRRMRPDSIMTCQKTIRHLEGYLVCYCEALALLRRIPVQADEAELVDHFLHHSLFRGACRVWQNLPEEEKQKPMTHGGVAAAHLLELVKRTSLLETQKDSLQQENNRLAGQLKTAKNKLKKLEEEKRKRLAERIKRFCRAVSVHGPGFALRKVAYKVSGGFAALMSRCTWGSWKEYFVLARKTGYRTARQELTRQRAEQKLRQLMKTGSKTPLVSFILPVYNVERYLEQAMDCLLGQTLKHIEIICVDDGSTDNSLEILNRYAAKDPRVRVFTQKNQFAGVARNHGLGKAKGEYVCFLDPDDFFEATLAEDAYFAAKQDAVDVVIFDAMRYDNVTKEFQEGVWILNEKALPPKQVFNRNDCPDSVLQVTIHAPWTKMFRRQFLLDTGLQFQALRNANDIYFVCTALAMAERITVLNKVLVYYRVNVSTSLQATKARDPLCFYVALKAVRDKLKELGLLEQLRRSFVNTALTNCVHYWRSLQDPAAKQTVEAALRTYIFRELEISGYDRSFYYVQGEYETMLTILGTGDGVQ